MPESVLKRVECLAGRGLGFEVLFPDNPRQQGSRTMSSAWFLKPMLCGPQHGKHPCSMRFGWFLDPMLGCVEDKKPQNPEDHQK